MKKVEYIVLLACLIFLAFLFNQLSWRVSRTIDTSYTVRHPLGWEKRNDGGVLLVLVNTKRVGAQGTDQPTESMVFKPLDKVCESTEWGYEPYFGGFYRVGCVSVNPHIHVEMVAFDVKSQRIEETILRSFAVSKGESLMIRK